MCPLSAEHVRIGLITTAARYVITSLSYLVANLRHCTGTTSDGDSHDFYQVGRNGGNASPAVVVMTSIKCVRNCVTALGVSRSDSRASWSRSTRPAVTKCALPLSVIAICFRRPPCGCGWRCTYPQVSSSSISSVAACLVTPTAAAIWLPVSLPERIAWKINPWMGRSSLYPASSKAATKSRSWSWNPMPSRKSSSHSCRSDWS